MQEVVSFEQAQKEVNAWLDNKQISQRKRETNDVLMDVLIDAVQYGHLVINDDNTLTHKLKFPIGEDNSIKELNYKARLAKESINARLKATKATDPDSRIEAYVCALTDKVSGIIGKLDTEDYSISQAVAIFFM